jgi:hypothetical protein
MGWAEWTGRGKEIMAQIAPENSERIAADLKIFFGPRAEIFLNTYDKMVAHQKTNVFTWSWPGFLLAFVWFFYRRLYIWGAALILVPIVLAVLFPSLTGGGMAYIGIIAKSIYVQAGLSRIRKADTLGLQGAEREDYLRRAGGVSLTAGILAGILYVLFVAAAFYEIANK